MKAPPEAHVSAITSVILVLYVCFVDLVQFFS